MLSNTYVKAIIAAVIPIIAAVSLYLQTGFVNGPELSLALTGLVAALAVAVARNYGEGVTAFSKFFAALLTPLFSVLIQWFVTGSFNQAEVITIVIGILTSAMVYLVGNGYNVSPYRPAD